MNEFMSTKVSLRNALAPEKSSHNPKRSLNGGDEKLTVATKPLYHWESNQRS